ncbi:MAG: hypothetical protein H7210_00130 [Pyrinomonadaceae bacterium]|nr:hypothetical protein [Phycisphaerales bacterium]
MPLPGSMPFPPLALALAGLPRIGPDVLRHQLALAAQLGYRAVQLDATVAGLRARDLDRSARRDLAALFRRSELSCTGLDLWIPAEHFTSSDQADRAVSAVSGALELAADLSRLSASAVVSTARRGDMGSVSLMLPKDLPGAIRRTLEERATTCGVLIADHTWPSKLDVSHESPIGIGLDPAMVLMAGEDPVKWASRLAGDKQAQRESLPRLVTARATSASTVSRVSLGARDSRLETLNYGVSLITGGYDQPVVVDVRGVADPTQAAEDAAKVWGTM